ncbi:hypothetical protein P9869_31575 [Streptomyces ossamyceticus]|nr:hypothetical protein [Streptomyces ossamyceticus]
MRAQLARVDAVLVQALIDAALSFADICPRGLPLVLIGAAGGALALWADAPPEMVVPVALLIVLDIRVRRWRRRT